ncbi:hypothetical protein F4778DRAFT_774762 [Xylariomycetidae sp. FL2044]|nr:hypothetical protein F4778DRAFT_774762 [Xylariomycetidae sp. FL2044]
MPLYSQLPPEIDTVDVIIAGEAGGNNHGDPSIVIPLLFLSHQSPESKAITLYTGKKSGFLANRELTETYHGDDPKSVHGHEGPIHISRGTYNSSRSESAFVSAAGKLGWKEFDDLSDMTSNNGVQRAKHYMSPDGKRQDTAHGYLHPRLQDGNHPNLHVLVNSQVVHILFDDKRASGVMYQPSVGVIRAVQARKTVVVSCGTCGTPPLLERSGIGNPEVLRRARVATVSELPGVGEGYEDHHSVSCLFYSDLRPDETLDGLGNGNFDLLSMLANGDKMLGWNCLDVSCKLRPSESDVAALGEDFQSIWSRDFESDPSKPLTGMSLGNILYPLSRGSVHITGPELGDPVDFDPGFFSDPEGFDVRTCRWAYKKQRELARRMSTYRGEAAPCHPPFSAESAARCIRTDEPLASDVADIKYTPEDDAVIDQWLRESVVTTWHPLGTCKMLPLEQKGVVDADLNVYGVTGLKIADFSICPANLGCHTNNTAMMIGEKAADILIKDLGLL